VSAPTTISLGNSFNLSWNTFDPQNPQSLVYTPAEYRAAFLYGIPLCNSVTGQTLSDSFYTQKLLAAQKYIEDYFGIKFFKQVIFETKDFIREEFIQWGYVKTNWQINKICSLTGSINNYEEIKYPAEWLCIKRSNANDNTKWKNLYIVPSGLGAATFNYEAISYNQLTFFRGARIIPDYWHITYITGFDRIPMDLVNLVGMKASIDLLPQLEMVIGVGNRLLFGNTSTSVSIDGLSQSAQKMGSGNIFKSRVDAYRKQLDDEMKMLKGVYKGITFDVC
jgi:hypothetical protein